MLEKIILNSASFNRLKTEVQNNRLFHALMFISEDKVIQEEFTKCILKLLFCENLKNGEFCNNCNNCKNAEKLIHPDILVYGKEKTIDIDDAEEIVTNAPVRPYSANKKVYLLYNFDEVNKTVENKLLKTIEEPPADCMFILLVSNTNKLLQTTLSRTQKVFLEAVPDSVLVDILKKNGTSDAEIIATESCGNVQKALALAVKSEVKEINNLVIDCLQNMNSTVKILDYSVKMQSLGDMLEDSIDALQFTLLDVIRIKSGNIDLVSNKSNLAKLKQIADELSFTALTKIVEQTYEAKAMIDANVSKVNIIDQLLLKIVEVRIKCKK